MSAAVLREYTYSLPGEGSGFVRIHLPATIGPADLDDLREWLALICRQLERLQTRELREAEGIIEYQSWGGV